MRCLYTEVVRVRMPAVVHLSVRVGRRREVIHVQASIDDIVTIAASIWDRVIS